VSMWSGISTNLYVAAILYLSLIVPGALLWKASHAAQPT
jgi:hypothetical protein